jgi:threonyl-tRNA synthetase
VPHPLTTLIGREQELASVLDLLRDYGLDDFYLELSTKPEGKAVGTLRPIWITGKYYSCAEGR